MPSRCSGGSASSEAAAGDGGGPDERGQPPPAPAGAANAGGGSTAAKQIADTRPDPKATLQLQAAEEGRPLLQEAIRLLQEAQVGSDVVPITGTSVTAHTACLNTSTVKLTPLPGLRQGVRLRWLFPVWGLPHVHYVCLGGCPCVNCLRYTEIAWLVPEIACAHGTYVCALLLCLPTAHPWVPAGGHV